MTTEMLLSHWSRSSHEKCSKIYFVLAMPTMHTLLHDKTVLEITRLLFLLIFFQKCMTQMLVLVAQWTKPPLTGHSAWWADGLTLAGLGSNPGLEGGFQLSRSSRHAMRLNALSGIL